MPRNPVRSVDHAPEASKEPLRRGGERFGKVLDIHGEMARGLVVQFGCAGVHRAAGWTTERTAASRALEGHDARTDLGVHAGPVLVSS